MYAGLINNSKRFLKKNGSTLLTIAGCIGTISTTFLAIKATSKASKKIEKEECNEKLSFNKKIILVFPEYIPTIISGVGTLACIISSNVLNKKHQTAIMSAYIALNKSYNDYKNKLIELYGEDANDNIQKSIIEEKIKADKMVITNGNAFKTTQGLENLLNSEEALFYDTVSERYFESTALDVYAAEYNLSRNFLLLGYVTPNDFYDFLGIPPVEFGDSIGWSMEEGYTWLDFEHSKVVMDDGLTVITINPMFSPDAEYNQDYHYENI